MFKKLKENGIDTDKDVRTIDISVSPRYRYRNNEAPELVGYTATNMVNITVKDITKLPTVMDSCLQEGSNRVNGISFQIEDIKQLEQDAVDDAIVQAKAKAQRMAKRLGVRIGRPIFVGESIEHFRPRASFETMNAPGGDRGARTLPQISGGTQKVTANVTIVFSINAANPDTKPRTNGGAASGE